MKDWNRINKMEKKKMDSMYVISNNFVIYFIQSLVYSQLVKDKHQKEPKKVRCLNSIFQKKNGWFKIFNIIINNNGVCSPYSSLEIIVLTSSNCNSSLSLKLCNCQSQTSCCINLTTTTYSRVSLVNSKAGKK